MCHLQEGHFLRISHRIAICRVIAVPQHLTHNGCRLFNLNIRARARLSLLGVMNASGTNVHIHTASTCHVKWPQLLILLIIVSRLNAVLCFERKTKCEVPHVIAT